MEQQQAPIANVSARISGLVECKSESFYPFTGSYIFFTINPPPSCLILIPDPKTVGYILIPCQATKTSPLDEKNLFWWMTSHYNRVFIESAINYSNVLKIL